jgi:CDP-paratose 2-epimerase
VRLLVTGGAGFVGANVAVALKGRHPDWEVAALDNLYRRGSELNLDRLRAAGVRFVHGDVRSRADIEAAGPFTAMVECSAEPSVMASGDVLVPVNLIGAHNCFEVARSHGAQVVFLSTSRVYPVGALEALPYEETDTRFELSDRAGVDESFPLLPGPRTVYGATKLAAEILLAEYEAGPWSVIRFGVIAGPWQMGKVDQGVFTHWLLSHRLGLPLRYIGYGGSGKQVRDLVHVEDAVDLIEMQLLDPGHWAGRTFNAGGGRAGSLSLLETTALCREITGNEVPVEPEPQGRPGDVRIYVTDGGAVEAHSGWRPRRSPRDVLEDTHAWIAEHEPLVRSALGL